MSADAATLIRGHEGFRSRVYRDHLGNLTVGWGHLIRPGDYIPQALLNLWFESDLTAAEECADRLYSRESPGWTDARRAVLSDMAFNLGCSKLKYFRRMLRALNAGDIEAAVGEMFRSAWAEQVPNRAEHLALIMYDGVY